VRENGISKLLMIGSDATKEVLEIKPIHISLQLISFPLPAYFSIFPAHYLAILLSGMLAVITMR